MATIGTAHYIILDMMRVVTIDSPAPSNHSRSCTRCWWAALSRYVLQSGNSGDADYGLCQLSGRDRFDGTVLTGGSHGHEVLH